MAPSHPLSWIPVRHERAILVTLILANILVMLGMGMVDGHLRTEATPFGIASFEFIGDAASAERALSAWGEKGRAYAAFSLGLDYLFLVLYSLLAAMLAGTMSRKLERRFPRISKLSVWVAWTFLFTGLFDAMENTALVAVVMGASDDLWPHLGLLFASIKFTLAAVGATYLLVVGCLGFVGRSLPKH